VVLLNMSMDHLTARRIDAQNPKWVKAAWLFLVLSTLVRLLQICAPGLAPDEAYYWDWSRRLSLGYYDQGPFIAYLIKATTTLIGTNAAGIRLGALLSCLGAAILVHRLMLRWYTPFAAFLAVLLLGLTPLMEVGSIIATYDPPLVFFYTLTLYLLAGAVENEGPQAVRGWIYAGIAAGFGLLSKHTMLFILPGLILFLAIDSEKKRWLRSPTPYMAFGITLLMYSGVIWWNAHHHWWTFGHLLFLTGAKPGPKPPPLRYLGDYIGSQAVLVGPVLFLATIGRLRGLKQSLTAVNAGPSADSERYRSASRRLFLLCMGWPSLLLFVLLSVKSKVQGNWAAFAWAPCIMELSASWAMAAEGAHASGRRVRCAAAAAVGLGLALTVALSEPQLLRAAGIKLKPEADLSNQLYGWQQTALRLQQVRNEMSEGGRRPVFIVGSGYQFCAEMAYWLPDRPRTYDMYLHYRLDMYAAYVEELTEKLGQDAVFINDTMAEDADLRKVFTEVSWDPPMPVYRRPYSSEPIRTVYIARCRGYRWYTGTSWHSGG
jgi:4-amino-4-deoxy-L-arabinose transferase-like glycosyltransferase